MILGNAVFNQQMYKRVKIQPQIQVLIKNDNFWAIGTLLIQLQDHRKYQKQRWSELFSFMEEVRVKTLILDYNCHSCILTQISHINFGQLKELWLRQNNITNIQQIQFLNAPSLELLRISTFDFIHALTIQKTSNPQEKYIQRTQKKSANPINCHFSPEKTVLSKNMNDIFLQYWQHNNTIFEDIGIIVKMSSQTIHDLWIKGQQRILQQKMFLMLKNRFLNIKIYRRQIKPQQVQE